MLRKSALVAFALLVVASASAQVKVGLDVLAERKFDVLQGKRVAVVTNHTALNGQGKHLIEVLLESKQVNIVKLFSPEHGLYGVKDEKVGDTTDEKTGLPVYSLYGKTRRPTPEMLEGVDVLVFDIQDIGTRYYTYISTLGLCMEEAAKHNIEVVVLDRPNPISGNRVEGPIADKAHLGFTAYSAMPVAHGMTVGELAKMFNAENSINAKVTVIPMEGWTRKMYWDDTGVKWVNPSPNMRSPTQALLYPAIGLLEASNVSVGRGTDMPFEVFGAPWIKKDELAKALNDEKLAGLRFEPIEFTPRDTVHKLKDQRCEGVRVIVTDRDKLDAVLAGTTFAWTLEHLYPDKYMQELFVRMLQNSEDADAVFAWKKSGDFNKLWKKDLEAFKTTREKYLIYK